MKTSHPSTQKHMTKNRIQNVLVADRTSSSQKTIENIEKDVTAALLKYSDPTIEIKSKIILKEVNGKEVPMLILAMPLDQCKI